MQVGRTSRATTNPRKERTFRSGPYLDKLFGPGGRVDDYLQRQICERIQQARRGAGLTQEDMASLLNVTTRAYQNYERNRVPFRRLSEIARITSVPQEWLLRGDAESSAPDSVIARLEEHEAAAERSRAAAVVALESIDYRLSRIEVALGIPDEPVREESS